MQHALTWGKSSKFFKEISRRGGGGKAANQKPPEVPHHLRPYWEAFHYLSKRRSYHAAGPNPISVEAIQAYASLKQNVPPYFGELLLTYVDALDGVYLDHVREQSPTPK